MKIFTRLLTATVLTMSAQAVCATAAWDVETLRQLQAVTAPEGNSTDYTFYSQGYSKGNWYEDGEMSTSVIINGEDIYIKNPLFDYYTDAWLHGKVSGDKATFTFPQSLGSYLRMDMYDYTYSYTDIYVFRVKAEEVYYDQPLDDGTESYLTMGIDEGNQTIEMTLGADGGIEWGHRDAEYLSDVWGIGAYYASGDEIYWDLSAELYDKFTPSPWVNEAPPASATMTKWNYKDRSQYQIVNVATEGSDIWIQGVDPTTSTATGVPSGWLKGTIDGNTATFVSGQYLGVDDHYRRPTFFLAGEPKLIEDEYGLTTISAATEQLTLSYDATAHKLWSADGKGEMLFVKKQLKPSDLQDNEALYYQLMGQVSSPLFYIHEDKGYSRPANPTIDKYSEYTYTGWGGQKVTEADIVFSTPNVDLNGQTIPADQCYYNICVNGEVFALWNDEFRKLPASLDGLSDIPYMLHEDYGLFTQCLVHDIIITTEGIETVSVQGFYKADNGTTYPTDIVTYDVATKKVTTTPDESGIRDITDSPRAISVEYFDLQGRPVPTATRGIAIERTVMSDGKVITKKIIK